jgi:hypothetical protein
MFTKTSRYYNLPTVIATDALGREVQAVMLRRLPVTDGEDTEVRDHDQLDMMSHRRYKDGTRYWHIADANSELEASELVRTTGRHINVPVK